MYHNDCSIFLNDCAYPVCSHENSNICRVQNIANTALEFSELIKSCTGIISLGIHDVYLFSAEKLKLNIKA